MPEPPNQRATRGDYRRFKHRNTRTMMSYPLDWEGYDIIEKYWRDGTSISSKPDRDSIEDFCNRMDSATRDILENKREQVELKRRLEIASQNLWSITKRFATLTEKKTGQSKQTGLIEEYEKEEATMEKMKIEDKRLKKALLKRRRTASALETDWRCDLARDFIEIESQRSSLQQWLRGRLDKFDWYCMQLERRHASWSLYMAIQQEWIEKERRIERERLSRYHEELMRFKMIWKAIWH